MQFWLGEEFDDTDKVMQENANALSTLQGQRSAPERHPPTNRKQEADLYNGTGRWFGMSRNSSALG